MKVGTQLIPTFIRYIANKLIPSNALRLGGHPSVDIPRTGSTPTNG